MTETFNDIQNFGREQLETASVTTANFAKGMQSIAAETTDYSKKVLEDHAAVVEKLLGAKSLESALQIQTDYAKSAYENAVAQATKIGELYQGLFKDAFRPFEVAFAKATDRH
ncbi:MAG TPA: phasin family protein [Methylovirgula sp.]|jgi:phasin family protein|nr:phasin family protein [Methylovirgula sp.]